jgi:hypothetical protein
MECVHVYIRMQRPRLPFETRVVANAFQQLQGGIKGLKTVAEVESVSWRARGEAPNVPRDGQPDLHMLKCLHQQDPLRVYQDGLCY